MRQARAALVGILVLWTAAMALDARERQPASAPRAENVVLVTLDGARWQEMFGGIDLDILRSTSGDTPVEKTETYQRFWAPTPAERRAKRDAVPVESPRRAGRFPGRQSRARQPRRGRQHPPLLVSRLLGAPHRGGARRRDHEQRQHPLPVPHRARMAEARSAAVEGGRGHVRLVGDLQVHRGARGRRHHDQRGIRAVRAPRSRDQDVERAAVPDAQRVPRRPPRRLHLPLRARAPADGEAARALHGLRRDRRLGPSEALRPGARRAPSQRRAARAALDVAAVRPAVPAAGPRSCSRWITGEAGRPRTGPTTARRSTARRRPGSDASARPCARVAR